MDRTRGPDVSLNQNEEGGADPRSKAINDTLLALMAREVDVEKLGKDSLMRLDIVLNHLFDTLNQYREQTVLQGVCNQLLGEAIRSGIIRFAEGDISFLTSVMAKVLKIPIDLDSPS